MATPSELLLALVMLAEGMTVLEAATGIQAVVTVGLPWSQSRTAACKLTLGSIQTHKDLMGCLLSHSVSKERVDKEPTEVQLELQMDEAKLPPAPAVLRAGEEQPSPLLSNNLPLPAGRSPGCPKSRHPGLGLPIDTGVGEKLNSRRDHKAKNWRHFNG